MKTKKIRSGLYEYRGYRIEKESYTTGYYGDREIFKDKWSILEWKESFGKFDWEPADWDPCDTLKEAKRLVDYIIRINGSES
jgi:alkyl sulfatase BDS1-like metallo-beta-lactamase superfamily hydrolase